MMANDGLCFLLLLGAVGVQGLCVMVAAAFPFILGALALRWVGRSLLGAASTEVAKHKMYDAALQARLGEARLRK